MRRFSQIASIVPVIVAGTFAYASAAFAAAAPPMTVTLSSVSGAEIYPPQGSTDSPEPPIEPRTGLRPG
jgi:hypothetical protein